MECKVIDWRNEPDEAGQAEGARMRALFLASPIAQKRLEDKKRANKLYQAALETYDSYPDSSVGILAKNLMEMVDADLSDKDGVGNQIDHPSDKYFHSKGFCGLGQKAARKGNRFLPDIMAAELLGGGKEIYDLKNKIDSQSPTYAQTNAAIVDSFGDMKANALGFLAGFTNPDDSCENLLKSIRPKRLLYDSVK